MKRFLSITLIVLLLLGLCACSENTNQTTGKQETTTGAPAESKNKHVNDITRERKETDTEPVDDGRLSLNVYSLKGPTSMGIVTMLEDSKNGKTTNRYVPHVCTAADEVTAALVSGDADIALLPANAAAALYNKNGGFQVIALNTLGVLYVVENGDTIHTIRDLAGKTVCLTGKGTTPEYTLRTLLAANGIEDQVTLEFKSEAQEVVAAMGENVATIGLLPQPFVTAAMTQNDKLRMALDLTEEWKRATDGVMVTGVTVVRSEVLKAHPEEIAAFLKDAAVGVETVNNSPETAAPLIEALGIVAKAPLAQKAIPYCNLVCIPGSEMKSLLSAYLKTLYDQNPKAIGGQMPADDFYYTGE